MNNNQNITTLKTRNSSTLYQNIDANLSNSNLGTRDASIIAIDSTARYGVIGTKQGLLLADLEYPYRKCRWLHHESIWKISSIKWCSHQYYEDYISSTSSNNIIIWKVP